MALWNCYYFKSVFNIDLSHWYSCYSLISSLFLYIEGRVLIDVILTH